MGVLHPASAIFSVTEIPDRRRWPPDQTPPPTPTKMTQLHFFVQDIFFVLFNFICVPSPYLWTPVPLLVEGRQVGSIVGIYVTLGSNICGKYA